MREQERENKRGAEKVVREAGWESGQADGAEDVGEEERLGQERRVLLVLRALC